jgi:hypothetical protein
MKILIIPMLCLPLASCAFLPTVRDVQAANDSAIQAWKLAGCALPLSAVLRNPDIIPALNSLCKPAGGADPRMVTK